MIKGFRHKGLRQFFETGSTAGILPRHADKLALRLNALNEARTLADLNFPGYRLHPLKGDKADLWAITVAVNWRITFEFREGDAYVVNYEDYH